MAVWWLARSVTSVPSGVDWLAPREADRAAAMRYPKRRTEFLLRRFAAKQAVAAALDHPRDTGGLARLEVANAASGAPYVLLDGEPAGLEVSLTDRAGWAVCVVAHDRVGCDLELVEPRTDGFVRDFLTAAEQRYVAARPDGDARHLAANLIWSATESALKVERTGLRRDTRSVEVTVHDGQTDGWAPLAIATDSGPLAGWWQRAGDYVVTVATGHRTGPPSALEVGAAMPRSRASTR